MPFPPLRASRPQHSPRVKTQSGLGRATAALGRRYLLEGVVVEFVSVGTARGGASASFSLLCCVGGASGGEFVLVESS